MKRIGLLAILTRIILFSIILKYYGVDIATLYGVFLISIDSMQIKQDMEGGA